MQLSLFTLIIIVSLMASISVVKTKQEMKIMKIPMKYTIEKTNCVEKKPQKLFLSRRTLENCDVSRKNRQISHRRSDRMTHVKAILSNPKISPSQHLAEKFARTELKSPKMRETFEKLTEIKSPRERSRDKAASAKIFTSKCVVRGPKKRHEAWKLPRLKGPRKKKRKRHKSVRSGDERCGNSNERRDYNCRGRFARQIAKTLGNNAEKRAKKRYEKSIDRRYDKELENLANNDENFQQDPYDNLNTGLNYPSVEDVDNNFQNSIIDENNSLNYGSNYSPMGYQSYDDTDLKNSMADNERDFSLANKELAENQFVSPEENSYQNVRYDENLNDPNSLDSREHENTMISRQRGFSSQNRFSPNNYEISDGKNLKNSFNQPRLHNNRNFRLSNTFDPRNNDFPDNPIIARSKNFERNYFPSNVNDPSKIINSLGEREKNHISESRINFDTSAKPTNLSKADLSSSTSSNDTIKSSIGDYTETVKNNFTTMDGGKNLKIIKASRVEKSDGSTGKLIFVNGKNCTTVEMNPRLDGIGDASAVTVETSVKKAGDLKNSKGMEYRLLAMNRDFEARDSKKSMKNRDKNTSAANETREVAGQILNKIIEELEDLKVDRNNNDHKEGLPCKLTGSWITTQAGVRIDMLVTNRSVNVSMAKLDLPVVIPRQGLLNYTWNITGYAPFRRGGPFSLVATDNHTKSLAVFVGACRVCQGVDTIEGIWSMAREPRDCRDFQMATSIYNDIFRRTQLLSAIREKQLGLVSTVKYPSTLAIPFIREEYSASNSGNAKIP